MLDIPNPECVDRIRRCPCQTSNKCARVEDQFMEVHRIEGRRIPAASCVGRRGAILAGGNPLLHLEVAVQYVKLWRSKGMSLNIAMALTVRDALIQATIMYNNDADYFMSVERPYRLNGIPAQLMRGFTDDQPFTRLPPLCTLIGVEPKLDFELRDHLEFWDVSGLYGHRRDVRFVDDPLLVLLGFDLWPCQAGMPLGVHCSY